MHSAPGARVRIGSDEYDYFCGTSYLGLHGHPDLANAVCQAVTSFGTGPATTRAGYGLTPMISAVEENAASYFGSESALYFSSGYLGAAILLQSLSGHYDHIFVDAESHYAIRDGIALSRKPYTTFMHCSVDDLEQNMRTHLKSGQTPLVISDGVFPVTGRMAPLQAYHQVLLSHRRGLLCIDDAHGLGVLGEHGRGSLEYCGVASSGRFAYGTLSKAFGGYGGIISGSAAFIDQIKKVPLFPMRAVLCPLQSRPPRRRL